MFNSMTINLALAVSFIVSFSDVAHATLKNTEKSASESIVYQHVCGKVFIQNTGEPKLQMNYCLIFNTSQKSDHLVYQFHGLSGNEKSMIPFIKNNTTLIFIFYLLLYLFLMV